jgi:hypothetical protein
MPISFAFSWAASEAILAASRERVGRLFVADMVVVSCVIFGVDDGFSVAMVLWDILVNGRLFKVDTVMCLLDGLW